MKLSLASLAMLSIGLTFAAPSPMPNPKGPPGPPSGTVGQASQSCGNSISQSSLHCCTQEGNAGPDGPDKPHSAKKTVKAESTAYDMQCSAIAGDDSQAVSSVCSVTVACCYGDGCVAIAY